jgi:hypothetical protein
MKKGARIPVRSVSHPILKLSLREMGPVEVAPRFAFGRDRELRDGLVGKRRREAVDAAVTMLPLEEQDVPRFKRK